MFFECLANDQGADHRNCGEQGKVLRHDEELLVSFVARVSGGPHGGERLAEEHDSRRAGEMLVSSRARSVLALGYWPHPGALCPRKCLECLDAEDAEEEGKDVALLRLDNGCILLKVDAPHEEREAQRLEDRESDRDGE